MQRALPVLVFLLSAAAGLCAAEPAGPPETVILLHGLGRSPASMWRIERALRRDGYHVVNAAYPSQRQPVEVLARDHLAPLIAAHRDAPRLHFVTHSLGGILLRLHLRDHAVPNLGRVVMLAPPNAGSELADHLKPSRFYRLATGPAGQQLGVNDLPAALGPWPAGAGALGIIAGDRTFNPWYSAQLPGPDDGKVTVAATRLEGMADFVTVHSSHTWLAWRGAVIDEIRAFLRTGRFAPAAPRPGGG